MRCPTCGRPSKILDLRPFGGTVRRRRQCVSCEARYTTMEVLDEDFDVLQAMEADPVPEGTTARLSFADAILKQHRELFPELYREETA